MQIHAGLSRPVIIRQLWWILGMTPASNGQPGIIRTERGLTIAGTRITLYDVMDYVTAQYPPKFIRGMLNLTDEQVNAALSYIEANRAEVEAEYQIVLQEAEEIRQYWEERNRERAIALRLFKLDLANPMQLTKLDSIESLLHHSAFLANAISEFWIIPVPDLP
jgi:uncharacterized protein (DUF433 family)